MSKPKVLVLAGYGLNCETETAYAFQIAGAHTDIVHINDVIENKKKLQKFQILAIPGGFSFGDDLGGGRAYAQRLQNHLKEDIAQFANRDTLIIGICNGFQILTQFGLLPGMLLPNDLPRYSDRWIDLVIKTKSPWLAGMTKLSCPIAHGEGKYVISKTNLKKLKTKNMIALRYANGEMSRSQNLPANPNGSLNNIAGVTNETGRVFGLMPHPERAMFFTQLPNWTYLKEACHREEKELPLYGPGLKVFTNAVEYFS